MHFALAVPVAAAIGCLSLPLSAQGPVLTWNDAAMDAIRAGNTPPPSASRNLAMLHAAMFDAINGVHPRYHHYLVAPAADQGASPAAAAIAAGHDVLVALYPGRAAVLDAQRDAELAALPDRAGSQHGRQWGELVASQLLAARANDGSGTVVPYPGSLAPGMWRPTVSFGGVVRPALQPQWGGVTPFCLGSGSQVRPPAPPALPSNEYADDVLFVQAFGGATGSARTAEQTEIARFWGYGPGTATPPGHWNQIARAVHGGRAQDLVDQARTFALLNIALADAAIVSWDCKYVFGLWRPITAIQLADQDGNPRTEPDPNWTPLLPTPPFPEYTSGHSTFSAAAAVVLASVFGTDRVPFQVGSDDLPGVYRRYQGFWQAARESGESRLLGGIHFPTANQQGLSTGAAVGDQVARTLLQPLRKDRSGR